MKVIGAGCPRTGTLSTQSALIQLGFPCYHMVEVAMHEEHTRAWHAFFVEKKPMDWRALFADYEATVDAPAAFFYREILEAFPDAKVVLNLRDQERWYKSLLTLRKVMEELRPYREGNARLKMWGEMVEAMSARFLGARPADAGSEVDHDRCIASFNEHNRRVQEVVPADKLLVFRVEEGWGPLCEFLGRKAPEGEPFPHLNEGPDTVRAGLSLAFELA